MSLQVESELLQPAAQEAARGVCAPRGGEHRDLREGEHAETYPLQLPRMQAPAGLAPGSKLSSRSGRA